DHWSWYCQAPLLLEIGDMDGYRRVCQELLTRFGKTNEAYIAERAAKTCLLVPNAVPNLSPVLQLAERAVTGTEKQAIYRWFLLARGMADYRAGRFAGAVDPLRKSLSPRGQEVYLDGMAYLFLALAHHRMGQAEEARQSLAKARALSEKL